MTNQLNALEENLTRIKNAKKELDDFVDIEGSLLLVRARIIYTALEQLESEIKFEGSKYS